MWSGKSAAAITSLLQKTSHSSKDGGGDDGECDGDDGGDSYDGNGGNDGHPHHVIEKRSLDDKVLPWMVLRGQKIDYECSSNITIVCT